MIGGPPTDAGVIEAAERIRAGDWTSAGLTAACLDRIEALEPSIQAWVHVDGPAALAEARERDAEAADGRSLGPLHGVPIGVKDIIDVAGMPTRAGAAAFAHTQPTVDAPLVARLRDAGAVILGKTHATQFAYRDPAPTHNPWSLEHTPGGSSSGSAAAVAARMVPAAIGTQTVGSILRPAAYCGVVGCKGAYGAVPLEGVVPLSRALDHAGPIARSVADAALLEGVADRRPDRDRAGRRAAHRRASAPPSTSPSPGCGATSMRWRAGSPTPGRDVREIELPAAFDALADAGRVLLETGAAATHERWFAAHAAEYAPTIRDLVLAGQARSAAEVAAAERVRAAARDAWAGLAATVDVLLTPVAVSSAPALAEGTGDGSLCAPWSTLGVPAIVLPTGLDDAGLPFAVQLVGTTEEIGPLVGVAAWCERVIGFDARPGV